MSRFAKFFLKLLLWGFACILAVALVLATVCVALHATADLDEPEFSPTEVNAEIVSDSLRRWKDNALRINAEGLWEMKVSGSAFERGEAIGKLAPDLLYIQEKAFTDKLFEMVPSKRYRDFLHYFITIFNRRLGQSVPLEYRQEIKGMSASCTHEFDDFGNPYERQMQYHSAHDIGHVMQDYMLVGCTSFAAWGKDSEDSSMIIGRNFDFYMGEDFARNKLILFEKPDSGYAYVSVTWPGMLGVLSGMNTEGLTVTINAAKLEVPTMSATPISILTKRILQYASTIDEAWKIAGEYSTFVSESIMVGSVNDRRVAIIEKTPSSMALYDPAVSDSSVTRIVCANHYQSDLFKDDPVNVENIRMSDSMHRFRRVEELLDSAGRVSVASAACILRDMRGEGGKSVGYCNELAINQLLAMHSVIFRPEERKIWVSTSPWQCGKFVCYDLEKVFSSDFSSGIESVSDEIPEDSFVRSQEFRNVLEFKRMTYVIQKAAHLGLPFHDDSLKLYVSLNPEYYNTYKTLSHYYLSVGRGDEASSCLQKALTLPMKESERMEIEKQLKSCR